MTARRVLLIFLLLGLVTYAALRRGVRDARPVKTAAARPVQAKPAAKGVATAGSGERAVASRWLSTMTLREKIGQLIVIRSFGEDPSSRSKAWKEFVHDVRDLRVGGVIVVNRVVGGVVRSAEPHAMATFLNRLQRMAKVPLIAGADFERGASMRVAGTAKYPHLMAYGAANDPQLTKALGAATAKEARALGIHWVFAPDSDVNNNPENPIINIRSFGEDPQLVARHVSAFIAGAHSDPNARVLVTAKHFPGHGDTNVDTHMGLASLNVDRARMDAVELVPFKAAVAAGVDSIMTAHMAVPAVEPDPIPSTVSEKVLTGIIRHDMQYKGLIVTDAMDMQGLAKEFSPGEAAVRALQAGVDVLLMPPDPDAVVKAVLAAVTEKRLTEKRINESVMRILMAKARVGLHRKKFVDVEQIPETIEATDLSDQAQLAADRAVTVVKNDGNVLPLKNPAATCFWVMAESRYGQGGRRLTDELRARLKQGRVTLLDPQISQLELTDLITKAGSCEAHVAAAYITVGAFRGNVALSGNYPFLMDSLMNSGAPVALVSLGNPYLLRSFPKVSAYMATFSPVPTAEAAAAKALFGEIAVGGKLPVSIPEVAKAGDGINIPAVTR